MEGSVGDPIEAEVGFQEDRSGLERLFVDASGAHFGSDGRGQFKVPEMKGKAEIVPPLHGRVRGKPALARISWPVARRN